MKNKEVDKITTDILLKIRNYCNIVFIVMGLMFSSLLYSRGILVLLCLCVMILFVNYIITKRLLIEVEKYSEMLELNIEKIIVEGKMQDFPIYQESILSRNQMQLKRLCESLNKKMSENQKDKVLLQTLVSDIAHQVKTPIANIVLYITALRKQNLSFEKREDYLNVLSEQIEKLDFLMDTLLKMSRLEAGIFILEPEVLPVQDTLASALGSIAIKAEKKDITMSVKCPEKLSALHDRKWTSEALENVLENAVKYTPKNGRISIAVSQYEMYTLIEIADNGIGILQEEIPQIFKRFYRGQNVGEEAGVGIGLYLVREILSREKGFISVESKRGKGSKFLIYLLNR